MHSYLTKIYKSNKEAIDNPDWDNSNSWEAKVPMELESLWKALPTDMRTAIYATAQYAYETESYTE